MELGTKIILTGISRHGKNRIEQHGSMWTVDAVGTFNNTPALLLQSENKTFGSFGKKTFDQRWVFLKDDPDFTFEVV